MTAANGLEYTEVSKMDYELVDDPLLNKNLSFSAQERDDFNLYGLIPPHIETLEEQSNRCYQAFQRKETNIAKYIYLRALQDTSEVVFYHLLLSHLTEMLPVVYTPVVGEGCQKFSEIYRRPRGLFISYPHEDKIDKMLANPRFDSVKAIVVTDGERILGLGDQGAGGMGIPIGKLSLYTACAGVAPNATLPITLDVGTNNHDRLNDPMYIGWRNSRVRGDDYDRFIDSFVTAIKKRFPHVLLQWEDFAQQNANPILSRYRDQLCTFNDDIQGTAAVATGILLAAMPLTGMSLTQHRIAVFGAGSAGCGISNLLAQAMIDEGLSEKEAYERFYLIDRNGLLIEGAKNLLPFQEKFCQSQQNIANWQYANKNMVTLLDVVKNAKPTVLIGVSGQAGAFTEEIVRTMAASTERPIIFPLSNPNSVSEASPSDLVKWTNDKVIVGTGSPFPSVMRHGISKRIDQTNNAYIFPGMGLSLTAIKATRVTDKMFMAAAKALAACSPALQHIENNLLPSFEDIRQVSYKIALAVGKEAIVSGFATLPKNTSLEELISNNVWTPKFIPYKKTKSRAL